MELARLFGKQSLGRQRPRDRIASGRLQTPKAILALGIIYYPEPHSNVTADQAWIACRDDHQQIAKLSTVAMTPSGSSLILEAQSSHPDE